MKNYQKTLYPRIFKNTPWGDELFLNENINYEGIYENRNWLVESHGIKKHLSYKDYDYCVNGNANILYPIIDHVEIYQIKDGRFMLLISPYISSRSGGINKFNFIKVLPVYCNEAISMIMFFNSKKEIKSFFVGIGTL